MKKLFFVFILTFVFCAFTPPGIVKIQSAFYMDRLEVSNSGWAEYINYLREWRQSDKESIKAALPDSATWSSAYHGIFVMDWQKNQDYPVVGVSYTQVLNFCKWRSEAVRIKYNKKVKYRLPSKEEWIKFANTSDFKQINATKQDSLQPVSNVSDPKKKDIYHLLDNVSEMTSEEGGAIGNNFTDKEKGLSAHPYSKPEKWLGFRCACEVLQ